MANSKSLTDLKFPEPKKIDWRQFIEPKKQIFVTKNGLTTALLINLQDE